MAQREHVDVLVVGAGISGVGAAYHLTQQCPEKSFVVLEARESFGGTWLTHIYPGIRSDSDLYTFGYRFKPWVGPPIATADEILKYMGEVIAENDLARHIRYGHKIISAAWDSGEKLWTITAEAGGETKVITANFLWMCQGYYRHNEGHTPEWPGMAEFQGELLHSETWPKDADMAGKRVAVIGSGATAATIVPAIAGEAAHVTIVQRSPTYFFPARNADDLADLLRALQIDETWIHEIVRRKRIYDQHEIVRRCAEEPEAVRAELLEGVKACLPEGFPLEPHFSPRYRPWQQRVAFVPEADLFQTIAAGKTSIVTDEIERFTKAGLQLKSGETIAADVVVAATGFNLSTQGDIALSVDGKPVRLSDTITYRGMMFTGLPNYVWIFGYFRASWTLRVDIVADFVCKLLKHMDANHVREVRVALRDEDKEMAILPWIDEADFNPGYLKRGADQLPQRGAKREWQHSQDYWREKDELPAIDLTDKAFIYS